jgi:RNA polymerase sigma-70 factor, ECF subfamily
MACNNKKKEYFRLELAIRYKPMDTLVSETLLIEQLTAQNESAFEKVFKRYYKPLYAYACTMVKETSAADDMVQQVFYRLWNSAERVNIQSSIAAYLYRAVYNESLNYLKHRQIVATHQKETAPTMKSERDTAAGKIINKELEQKLQQALNALPEQCRTVFQLSRFENLKYYEIAERLGISVKTVENQMGKALKIMRAQLMDLLPLILILLKL